MEVVLLSKIRLNIQLCEVRLRVKCCTDFSFVTAQLHENCLLQKEIEISFDSLFP